MMHAHEKANFLRLAQTHLDQVSESADQVRRDTETSIHDLRLALQRPSLDFITQRKLLTLFEERHGQLKELIGSPYFNRCDIQFADGSSPETFYISKFSFPERHLISWVAPLARLRFEYPGPCSYILPDGSTRAGVLQRTDQYMIVDKKLLFFAKEEGDQGRELIYQEHFTHHKTDFSLPEILAQMEKAQDDVLRIPPQGSLRISGPAGSGKTTLALHRVAFLSQSPDTAPLFPHRRMIVFVQDASTRTYFSHLLPTLGIHDVRITTFETWAMQHLHLDDQSYRFRIGDSETIRDQYEYEKNRILASAGHTSIPWQTHPLRLLDRIYTTLLPPNLLPLWKQQKQQKQVDRFDLTLLLLRQQRQDGVLSTTHVRRVRQKNGVWKEKTIREGYHYALMVLDEIQNYLPHQVQLLKNCIDPSTHAMMYIGDLAQQTRIGGLKRWTDVDELTLNERTVTLQKGYRQTQQLIEYIQSRGYSAQIPPQPKQGPRVQEHRHPSSQETYHMMKNLLTSSPADRLVGILAIAPEDLLPYQDLTQSFPHVRCMTIHEAQGVEFDTVYFLEYPSSAQTTSPEISADLKKEQTQIARDLLYVALTRAMHELHVFL